MGSDLTARTATGETPARFDRTRQRGRFALLGALLSAALGALLVVLLSQIPARHAVDIGGFDAAYARGFFDPERADAPAAAPYLAGSDGSARWTRATSYLVFPQAGLPAEVTLSLRGWRADAPPPEVVVTLDGGGEVARLQTTGEWQELTFSVGGGLLKPEDVVVAIDAATGSPMPGDEREVGVLLDRAVYRAGPPPLTPYPAQLAWGALAGTLLFLLGRPTQPGGASRRRTTAALAGLALALAYLLLYRLQPPYPFPLLGLLPAACALLGALLALRHGPALAARAPALLDALAVAGVGLWLGATLLAAQAHVTLSVPGVEKDFRVFATRAVDPALIFRADGFYNLGYPLLLWLTGPLVAGSPFLAGRLVGALSGALLLGASWWLARGWLGRGPALLALATLALSPFVVQYGLYVGSDMPFAALSALALALLLRPPSEATPAAWRLAAAGAVAGAAFLVRHPGLLLLPLGWLALVALHGRRGVLRAGALYTAAFLLAIAPQLTVNLLDTGQPLYSQQAKNVWLAVYGSGDWGRWGEVSNDVSLLQVIAQDPTRFAASWWANLRAFFGTGAEDASEFGRAMQLRLLGFPANWLAAAGLLGWLALAARSRARLREAAIPLVLLAWVALYAAALSVGLPLQRFFLPLAPVYALAAAWLLARALTGPRARLAAALLLLALLAGGFGAGTRTVLGGQPAEQVAAVALVQGAAGPGERVTFALEPGDPLGKYSAVAHLEGAGSRLLLHAAGAGPAPSGEVIGRVGPYTLLRVSPGR